MSTTWKLLPAWIALLQPDTSIIADDVPDSLCGAYCLYLALHTIDPGATLGFEELIAQLGPRGETGYSMQALALAAKRYGAHTLEMKTDLNMLNRFTRPFVCVSVVNANHFILIQNIDRNKVFIVDFPRKYTLPNETFDKMWNGECLLIAGSPILQPRPWSTYFKTSAGFLLIVFSTIMMWRVLSRKPHEPASCLLALSLWIMGCDHRGVPPAGHAVSRHPVDASPGLVLSPSEHNLGVLSTQSHGESVGVITVINNQSDDPIKILHLGQSCSCTSLSIDRHLIQPGQSAKLMATIQLGTIQGPRSTRIELASTDPIRPTVQIPILWRVERKLRASADQVSMNQLKLNSEASTIIKMFVRRPIRGFLEIRAVSDTGRTNLAFQYSSNGQGLAGATRITRHDAVETDSDHGVRFDEIGELTLRVRETSQRGTFRDVVRVEMLSDGARLDQLEIPVSWTVVSDIEASPERFAYGLTQAGARTTATLLLRSMDRKPFRLMEISCEDQRLHLVCELPEHAAIHHKLSLELQYPDGEGPWTTFITITTHDPGTPSVVIPISALLQKASS